MSDTASSPTWKVLLAFAAVYVIWGSTYLAIRFVIETIPPFLGASVRFLLAGLLLYSWLVAQGAGRPRLIHWRSAAIVGILMLTVGNGGLSWAEQTVPSGVAALLVASTPLWMVLLDWLRPAGNKPTPMVIAGLILGMVGIILLVGLDTLGESGGIDPVGASVVLLAALSWAAGSLYSRGAALPPVPLQATAMQMLAGGAVLFAASLLTGETAQVEIAAISLRSLLALLYLIFFGSIIAFSAYIWLLRTVPAASVATYAYVNPIVAIFLGWALADEAINGRTILATVLIVTAVAIITEASARQRRRAARTPVGV